MAHHANGQQPFSQNDLELQKGGAHGGAASFGSEQREGHASAMQNQYFPLPTDSDRYRFDQPINQLGKKSIDFSTLALVGGVCYDSPRGAE